MSEEVVKILLSIALAVVSGAISIATIYAKRYIAEKYTAEQLASIKEKVMTAVKAAEMIGASYGWDGYEKKAWVVEQLSEITGISEEQLDMFIEAAVSELKHFGEELVKVEDRGIMPKYAALSTAAEGTA